jgi:uncharacterized protein YchJ
MRAYVVKDGFVANPLMKIPRNSKCPCQSGKKFKVCCMSRVPRFVTAEIAEKHKKQMLRPNLTFRIVENTKGEISNGKSKEESESESTRSEEKR